MKKKTIIICAVILLFLLGLIFQNSLIRAYVSLFSDSLETYAEEMLKNSENTSGRYGLWKTRSYPAVGMVEFRTGGFGLAPNSTYKGFYYAADDTHKPFSAAVNDGLSMEIDGDHAAWTDGTDNQGTSVRITEKWFWYEASF